jgi:hypothetical protein
MFNLMLAHLSVSFASMSIKPTGLIKGVIQMSEMLKKMGLFGIGVISLKKEKVEERFSITYPYLPGSLVLQGF